MFKTFLFLAVVLFVFSCGKDENTYTMNYHETYYPLETGVYVDYEVIEIQHDENAAIPHDTTSYYLRTLISDTVIDNEGREAFKFIRLVRDDTNATWEISDVWTTISDDHRLELTEENRRKVKLIFPPKTYTTWDANVYNSLSPMQCIYEGIHEPYAVNLLNFDSTIRIEQDNVLNLVAYRRKYEIYANHVGLVKKHFKDLVISNFDTLNISSGSELMYNCIGFGIE